MSQTDEQFDIRPRAVDTWLDNLPIAHIGETARQLYTTMRDVNQRDDIPVRHHFHLLEGIAEPLNLILPELHRHYIGKPLPLSTKRRKVADLYTQLLRQTILGYEQVIAHAIELNRFGWKKVVTTAVHRIFHYSSLLLCNYRLLYLPYQRGLWQQLYWLYQLVEKYNMLDTRIAGVNGLARKSTLRAEFKKLLLHALLSPNLLKVAELQQVIDNMDIWIEHIQLHKTFTDSPGYVYAFTLDTDLPPGLLANCMNQARNPAIEVRYLDITPLLQFLNRLLDQTTAGCDEITLSRHRKVARRTLLILLNLWGRPTSRDGERRLIQGQAEIAIGISAIHYVISEGRQPATQQSPAVGEATDSPDRFVLTTKSAMTTSELNLLGFAAERDQEIDVWETVYFEPEAQPPSWTESIRLKVYSYLNARVLNISKGGFCIALPQNGLEHIQTNELVVMRGKKGEWQLGEIRWLLCPGSAPIRAGIQKLSHTVLPAQLHIQPKAQHTQPIKCLLGQKDNDELLFLPNLPLGLVAEKVMLEVNGELRKVTQLEQRHHSPIGAAYLIRLEKRNADADNSTTASADYQSIWASL